jgi:hypothetical protein
MKTQSDPHQLRYGYAEALRVDGDERMRGKPAVTVLTSPQRSGYYERTIELLDETGATKLPTRILFVDGPASHDAVEAHGPWGPLGGRYMRITPPEWNIRSCYTGYDGRVSGTKKAMVNILRWAADVGVSDLYYFEDDVLPAKNAVLAMQAIVVPDDCAFLTFCDIKWLGGEDKTPGIRRFAGFDEINDTGHWGNQALKIPRATLQYFRSGPLPPWHHRHASDVLLSIIVAQEPAPWNKYGVVAPSLVQHIGLNSLANPREPQRGHGREAANFVGKDFDALAVVDQINRSPGPT